MDELKALAETAHIPVTNTLVGLGGFPGDHELALGMVGMHGSVAANNSTDEADLVIAAGSSLPRPHYRSIPRFYF